MATREENLKKINDELELLSDEQLDEIAGGVRPWAHPICGLASAGGNAAALNQRLELAGGNVAALR